MTKRLFISYSSRDRDVADVVRAHLEAAGLTVWIAPRDVPPGMSYPEAIIGAIRDCTVGLLVLSDQSNTSPHVLREVERISIGREAAFRASGSSLLISPTAWPTSPACSSGSMHLATGWCATQRPSFDRS